MTQEKAPVITSIKTPITVTIITLNESKNIARAIESVRDWAAEIVVVDSGSTDQTCEIASKLGARVFRNPWPGYGKQKNYAQSQALNDWVLNIDADEEVSKDLAIEIAQVLNRNSDTMGFRIPRKTWYLGRWILHGGWHPNYLVRLANRQYSKWTEPRVHESLLVEGNVETLSHPLLHYTFENMHEQIQVNLRYAREGFEELERQGQKASIFKLLFKPVGKFIETYFLKQGFRDGMAGLIISINAAHSMFLKYAFLFEKKLSRDAK